MPSSCRPTYFHSIERSREVTSMERDRISEASETAGPESEQARPSSVAEEA